MPVIKRDYTPEYFIDPNSKRESAIFRPLIPVRITYNHKITKAPILSLLDSGADNNLFPSSLAEYLGIKLEKGKSTDIMGIGGVGVKAYKHKVKLTLKSYDFTTDIDFSPFQTQPLLGRISFFKYFKRVSFFEENKYFELEY